MCAFKENIEPASLLPPDPIQNYDAALPPPKRSINAPDKSNFIHARPLDWMHLPQSLHKNKVNHTIVAWFYPFPPSLQVFFSLCLEIKLYRCTRRTVKGKKNNEKPTRSQMNVEKKYDTQSTHSDGISFKASLFI